MIILVGGLLVPTPPHPTPSQMAFSEIYWAFPVTWRAHGLAPNKFPKTPFGVGWGGVGWGGVGWGGVGWGGVGWGLGGHHLE